MWHHSAVTDKDPRALKTLADRVQHALAVRGISGRAVDRAVYNKENASGWITMVKRGKKKPTIDTIERAAEALRVRAAWLAFGDGEMDIAGEDTSLLVDRLAASGTGVSNFRIAELYYGKKVPREAIDRVQSRMPAVGLEPDEIGDLFFEAAREIIREQAEKKRKRETAPEPEAEPTPAAPHTEEPKKHRKVG